MLLEHSSANKAHCCRVKLESDRFSANFKQPSPASITKEELLLFNMESEYQKQRLHAPLLHSAIAGSMGLTWAEVQVGPS